MKGNFYARAVASRGWLGGARRVECRFRMHEKYSVRVHIKFSHPGFIKFFGKIGNGVRILKDSFIYIL